MKNTNKLSECCGAKVTSLGSYIYRCNECKEYCGVENEIEEKSTPIDLRKTLQF